MCVNITRNVTRHPMPAEEKQQRQNVSNSYSAVILRHSQAALYMTGPSGWKTIKTFNN